MVKKDKEINLTVNFPVKLTKKGSVSKSAMVKCCKEVFQIIKRDKVNLKEVNVMGEITDSENNILFFDFMKHNNKAFLYDFSFSVTTFCSNDEVNTTLWIDYENGQHRELDFYNSEIEVSID